MGPTPGFAANRAVAIEVVLKFRQNPVPVQNRESTRVAKPRGPLEEESVPRKPLEEDPVLRAPGRLQKSIWTPGRHQAGKDLWTAWGGTREAPASRKGPFGQPARHQGGIWDCLGGTRDAGKDHLGQPGRHQGGRKGPIGQPARHQGGTREAGKDLWTAWEAPGRPDKQACKLRFYHLVTIQTLGV